MCRGRVRQMRNLQERGGVSKIGVGVLNRETVKAVHKGQLEHPSPRAVL